MLCPIPISSTHQRLDILEPRVAEHVIRPDQTIDHPSDSRKDLSGQLSPRLSEPADRVEQQRARSLLRRKVGSGYDGEERREVLEIGVDEERDRLGGEKGL